MISLPAGSRIWLVAGVTDMRNGFNGLASRVQSVLNDDPFCGHLFIFRGRRGDMIKLLWADDDGLCLFVKRLEAAAAVTRESDIEAGSDTAAEKTRVARSSPRMPLPVTLPRETVRIEPTETVCPICGGELAVLSETLSEQLDIINNAFKVIETIRPKLACRKCDAIVQAPLPAKPIDRSYASPGLLARILVAKYVEHIPLYRQCDIYARHGLGLSRNTLDRWVLELAEVVNNYVLETGNVHADDTPVPVQAPGSGKTRTGRLWVYVRDDRNSGSSIPAAVWFAYSADRKGEHPQRHLSEYHGVLQADAYGGYDALYETGRITEAACLAKNPRRACPVADGTDYRGAQADRRTVCHRGRYPGPPGGKAAGGQERKEQAVDAVAVRVDPGAVENAVGACGDGEGVRLHAEAMGRAERVLQRWSGGDRQQHLRKRLAVRCVALGRRNYLFFGSDRGGEAAAIIYSLLCTCKLNGVEPEGWLRDVLGKISDWPSNRVYELCRSKY